MEKESEETAGNSFNWREYLDAVLKRIWIVILTMALGAGAALYVVNGHEPAYQARSVLFIQDQPNRVLDTMKPLVDGQFGNTDMINTMVDGLLSSSFALRVVNAHKLNTDPDFLRSAGIEDASISP